MSRWFHHFFSFSASRFYTCFITIQPTVINFCYKITVNYNYKLTYKLTVPVYIAYKFQLWFRRIFPERLINYTFLSFFLSFPRRIRFYLDLNKWKKQRDDQRRVENSWIKARKARFNECSHTISRNKRNTRDCIEGSFNRAHASTFTCGLLSQHDK